jgi:hypothetical protein
MPKPQVGDILIRPGASASDTFILVDVVTGKYVGGPFRGLAVAFGAARDRGAGRPHAGIRDVTEGAAHKRPGRNSDEPHVRVRRTRAHSLSAHGLKPHVRRAAQNGCADLNGRERVELTIRELTMTESGSVSGWPAARSMPRRMSARPDVDRDAVLGRS